MDITTGQRRQMVELRKKGVVYRVIADMIGCCETTVRNHLLEAGLVDRAFTAKKKTRQAMLVHDWNAGMPTEQVMRLYKFKSDIAMHQALSGLRHKGYKVNYRNRCAKRELLQAEQVFADGVRESEAAK